MKSLGGRLLDLSREQWYCLGLCLVVFLAFLIRLAPIGRYVTPDEPAWVERSIRFADALAAGDWNAVPSTGHPGVTTMWLGAAGVTVRTWVNPAESTRHRDWVRHLAWLAPENGEAFGHLAFFLPYGRVAVALTTSLALVAVYGLVQRLFDRQAAFLTLGLLAFEPFLVGHAGLLHTDGLLATFSALSVLCLLMGVRDGGPGKKRRRVWWVLVSGVLGGLALLTKSLAGYLVFFMVIVLASAWLFRRIRLSHAIGYAALWGLSGVMVYVGLYPAMWANPLQTVQDLLAAPAYQTTTALMPTFFAGRTALRHGPEFYLVALPFRVGPIVLVGALLGVGSYVRNREVRPELAWLAVFCIGYVVMLSLSAKRYQRYLLPTIGPLAVIAALSWSDVWRSKRWDRRVGLLPLVLLQLVLHLPFAAHPLTSFNLLLGGPWVGRRLLSADWGEGMGAAARWLNRHPDAETLTVAASSVPSFASLFQGHTVPLDRAPIADYVVRDSIQSSTSTYQQRAAYSAMVGSAEHAVVLTNTAPIEQADYLADRAETDDLILLDLDTPLLRQYDGPGELHSMAGLPHEAAVADWLAQRAPERSRAADRSIWLVSHPLGSPITAVHLQRQLDRMASPSVSASAAGATITEYVTRSEFTADRPPSHKAAFGGQLMLVDGVVPEKAAWPDQAPVVLRWRAVGQVPSDFRAVVALRDDQRHTWSRTEMLVVNSDFFPTSAWNQGEWSDPTYNLPLPATIPPGSYAVEISLYRVDTGARLGANGPDGGFRGTRVPVGVLEVTPPESPPDAEALAMPRFLTVSSDIFSGRMTLLGLDPPVREVLSGDDLSFALFWQADVAPEADYRVRLRLETPEGASELEQTQPLSRYPTSRWHAGDRFQTRHTLDIPPELPPGRYRLMLDPVDPRGQATGEDPVSLASVEVLRRERAFELPPDLQNPLKLTFGETIHLRGYELGLREANAGEVLPVTRYWQAEGPTVQSYVLFVHLLGPDGRLHGQVDVIPGGGEAPTSSWAPGQVIVDRISLPVASDAPTGDYQIAMGFYDPAYGHRLPITDDQGRPLRDNRATLPVDIAVSRGSQ